MSYILEALKKSEEERRLGHVPDLTAPSSSAAPVASSREGTETGRGSRRLWPWLLGLLLAANLAFSLWLFQARMPSPANPGAHGISAAATPGPDGGEEEIRRMPGSGKAVSAQQAVDAGERTPKEAPGGLPDSGNREDAARSPIEMADRDRNRLPAGPVVLHPRRLAVDAEVPGTASESTGVKASSVPRQTVARRLPASSADRTSTVPTWDELPVSVRERFRLPHLDVHVYASDPARRFVRLDLVKYREGERTPEGLLVERIRRDGVVLSWQGTRFLLTRP